MTYSLSASAGEIVNPARLFNPQEALHSILENGITHGIYGWWFDDSLPLVPRTDCESVSGRQLLYVGISPSRPRQTTDRKPSHLYERLSNHIGGKIGMSTLRFTLASLLESELDLLATRSARGKQKLDKIGEDKISNWIASHGKLSFAASTEPWLIEDELLKHGSSLRLNIKGSDNTFKPTLKSLRKQWGR